MSINERLLRILLVTATVIPAAIAATLPVAADSAIVQATPAANLGGAPSLAVSPGGAAFFRFNLAGLPSAITPTSVRLAYLRVFVNGVTAPGTVSVSPVNGAWTETGLNFATAPARATAIGSFPATTANAFVVIDVTAQVQAWIAAPASNFGLALEPAPGSTVSATFDSKENALSSHPAELEISFAAPAGPAGVAGPGGSVGPQGAMGPVGPAGPQGPSGSQGATGPVGTKGATGDAGPQGPAGPAGTVAGPQGPQGPAGPIGAKGVTGDPESAGPIGPAGSTGPAGAPGAAGIAGTAGPKGPTGPLGAQGVAGPAGPAGPSGAPGGTGPVGAAGDLGSAGPAGPQGPAGTVGPQGPQGPAGESGPFGNAYPMDPTIRPSGYTIPNSDPFVYYVVANPTAATVSINLPRASRLGHMVHIMINDYAFANANRVNQALQVNAQSTDRILTPTVGSSLTSHKAAKAIRLVSDGNGKWYVIGQL